MDAPNGDDCEVNDEESLLFDSCIADVVEEVEDSVVDNVVTSVINGCVSVVVDCPVVEVCTSNVL